MVAPVVPRVALVLAGGGARGAYEVGVLLHLVQEVARDVGPLPIRILSGTSVGAINACAFAAGLDDPVASASRLAQHWLDLRVTDVVQPSSRDAIGLVRTLVGRPSNSIPPPGERRGGLLDIRGLERIVRLAIPFDRIGAHQRSGLLDAVTVSATHVASGKTVVFVDRDGGPLPPWTPDATVVPRSVEIGPDHVLASAAIPFVFPAVSVDDEMFCDGGLRQNIPLSPARRLGASGLLAVNPRHVPSTMPSEPVAHAREAAAYGPLFLLGKALNALLLDRIDNDVDRLEHINALLDAGTRRFGPGFIDAINEELGKAPGQGVRPLRTILLRSSQDIGAMSAAYVRSPLFAQRVGGVLGKIIRRIADGDAVSEADFLSYVLFDGEFARQLIELGRADARARHEEICAFFEEQRLHGAASRPTLRVAARS